MLVSRGVIGDATACPLPVRPVNGRAIILRRSEVAS
jgi:hypothetical protein